MKQIDWFESPEDARNSQNVRNMIHEAVVNPSSRAKMWSGLAAGLIIGGLVILVLAMIASAVVAMFS